MILATSSSSCYQVNMGILCSIANLTLTFGQRKIFDQASLTLHEKDRIGLIGLNGQGKSTLFNILTEQVHPDHTSPAFTYDKSNKNFSVLLIPQELNFHDFTDLTLNNYYLAFYPALYTIHQQLEQLNTLMDNDSSPQLLEQQHQLLEQFEFLQGWKIQANYASYLKFFEIDKLTSPLSSLSGGEQRKIALSVGLSATHRLILWDEPTNHLDIVTIERFEQELSHCEQTFMIISHDRYLLSSITNTIMHIEYGKISTFRGTYLDYLEHLQQRELERAKNLETLKNRHRRELAWMRQGIKARGTRSKKRVEGFHQIEQDINELQNKKHKQAMLSLQHSGRKSKQLITISNGKYNYGEKPLLEEINLSICKGDKIGLVGANGTGKTTLVALIQGELPLQSGKYKVLDDLKIRCFSQKREALNTELTPVELIADGKDMLHTPQGEIHVTSYLQRFLFDSEQINRPIAGLSGGEKNRLQLALFMKESADLWIFDEPTNDLDIETIQLLEHQLRDYQGALIIIGHDRAFLDAVCQQTWFIHQYKLEIFTGGFSQVAQFLELNTPSKKKVEVSTNVPSPAPSHSGQKKKLNYKQQKRLACMEEIILEKETELEEIETRMANFDFSNMDQAKQQLYNSLNNDKERVAAELQELYLEWEELEAISS